MPLQTLTYVAPVCQALSRRVNAVGPKTAASVRTWRRAGRQACTGMIAVNCATRPSVDSSPPLFQWTDHRRPRAAAPPAAGLPLLPRAPAAFVIRCAWSADSGGRLDGRREHPNVLPEADPRRALPWRRDERHPLLAARRGTARAPRAAHPRRPPAPPGCVPTVVAATETTATLNTTTTPNIRGFASWLPPSRGKRPGSCFHDPWYEWSPGVRWEFSLPRRGSFLQRPSTGSRPPRTRIR